jgi:KaiC/GvpD/RAD55 family RecA-like ATPase/ribosomal protein L37AE/L43A
MVSKEPQELSERVQDKEENRIPDCSEATQEEGQRPLIGIVGIDYSATDYLDQRSVTYRKQNGYVVARCPVCRNAKRTLKVEAEFGAWSCSSCSRSGAFRDLKRVFGDTASLLAGAPDASQFEVETPLYTPIRFHKDYQKDFPDIGKIGYHDIPDKTVRAFSLGFSKELDAFVFPYKFGRSVRSTSYLRFLRVPNDWWRVAGDTRTSAWFGQHLLKPGLDEIVVCRTPLDVVMLHASGHDNIVAAYGDDRHIKLRSHHLSVLHRAGVVYVVLDGTEEGDAWARTLQAQIGKWRCKLVDFPFQERGYDFAGFQLAKGKATVCKGLASHRSSRWIDELDEEFLKHPKNRQSPTHLEPLDKILGGWRNGEVTVLSGESGIGKSTLAAFLSLLQASDDVSTLFLTFEVLPRNIIKKWMCMLADSSFESLDRSSYSSVRKKLASRPLYVGDNYGVVELSEIRRCVYDAATRYGMRFLVIDHFGHLCAEREQDESHIAIQGRILREIKRWSMDLNIHILLLAHLRKQGLQKTSRALDDLRGSAEIYQTADNVMLLERRRGEQSLSTIRLMKCRDDSGYEGKASFSFNTDSLRFIPSSAGRGE